MAALILWSAVSVAGNADSDNSETRRIQHFPIEEGHRQSEPSGPLSYEFGLSLAYNTGYDIFKPHYFGMSGDLALGFNIGKRSTILPMLELSHFQNQPIEVRGRPAYGGMTALALQAAFRYTSITIATRAGLFVQTGGGIFTKMESGGKTYFLLHYGLGVKFPISRKSSMFVLVRHSGYRDGAQWWTFIPITVGFVF